jgi:hypothetical protein
VLSSHLMEENTTFSGQTHFELMYVPDVTLFSARIFAHYDYIKL